MDKIDFHIILIGFMGVGKTSISHVLKDKLNMPEVDTDTDIVKSEGREIADVFASHGENYFRDLESRRIVQLKDEIPSIVSCGGGIVMRKDNVSNMRKIGKIVCLTAEPETIFERVKNTKERPILNGNMNVEYISALMEKRKEFYADAADIQISTDNKSFDEIADEIIEKLELYK